MTSHRFNRLALTLGAPLLVFAVVLGVLSFANRASDRFADGATGGLPGVPAGVAVPGDTAAAVANLEDAVRDDPASADFQAALGDALYQLSRETGEAALIERSQQAFDSAIALDPEHVTATIGQGTLALARHRFRRGLEYGLTARRLAPDLVRPYTVLIDARIELGQYRAAAQTIDRLLALKPTLAAYSRASYYRQLNGDLGGAVQAMNFAVSASGGSGEGAAYVQSLLGELNIDRGRYGQARDAFEAVLAVDPGYLPAREGIAHLDATSGRVDRALRSYRAIVAEQPIAAYALAMADVESVAGKDAAAQRHVDLAAREIERLRASGVNADAGFVLFEANYGKPEQAVELGRQTWQEAPSVDSANAYAWALHRAGRDRAASRFSERSLRLGSADPAFLFDAGIIARAAGRTAQARRYLERVVEQSPRFSPVSGPKAERLLARLR